MSSPASPLHSPADSISLLSDDSARPRLRRCRTSSSLFSTASKVTLALPTKTDPSLFVTLRTGNHGAFTTPTTDAHSALQLFTTPFRRPRRSLATPPLPLRIPQSIPSISRTASSIGSPILLGEFDHGYALPQTTLASLERSSRLCSPEVHCATCGVLGSNFPSCARCGQAWCSRACRLPGGMRHPCAKPAGIPASPNPILSLSNPPIQIPVPKQ
ncbi:hypothetical protein C8F01DRAFT_1114151 [Mycena amicta]|nr:hypothetical protein C8F01DRAFT_1114151 [Mycena amicta]